MALVPSPLLRAQRRLGLSPTQLAVLMQLCDFWWDSERKPYPSKATLAERLGLSPRQVQRHVAELETAGIVRRTQRRLSHGGKTTDSYDLGGLVNSSRSFAKWRRRQGRPAGRSPDPGTSAISPRAGESQLDEIL